MKEFLDFEHLVTFSTAYHPSTGSRTLQLDIAVSKDCDVMDLMEKINDCVDRYKNPEVTEVPLWGLAKVDPSKCRIENDDQECGCGLGQCAKGLIF